MAQTQSYDAVAMVLARSIKSPAELELERQLFRMRARRDARNVMQNYRSEEQFYSHVEGVLFFLCNQHLRVFTANVAVALLQRALLDHPKGNAYMAIRSRLVQARYFRRFGFEALKD